MESTDIPSTPESSNEFSQTSTMITDPETSEKTTDVSPTDVSSASLETPKETSALTVTPTKSLPNEPQSSSTVTPTKKVKTMHDAPSSPYLLSASPTPGPSKTMHDISLSASDILAGLDKIKTIYDTYIVSAAELLTSRNPQVGGAHLLLSKGRANLQSTIQEMKNSASRMTAYTEAQKKTILYLRNEVKDLTKENTKLKSQLFEDFPEDESTSQAAETPEQKKTQQN